MDSLDVSGENRVSSLFPSVRPDGVLFRLVRESLVATTQGVLRT